MTLDWKDLKSMSASDLARELGVLRERRRALRFRVSQNQEKKVREIRSVRTAIAQIMTLLGVKKPE